MHIWLKGEPLQEPLCQNIINSLLFLFLFLFWTSAKKSQSPKLAEFEYIYAENILDDSCG